MIILLLIFPYNVLAQEEERVENNSGISAWELGFGLGVEQYKDDYIESASIRGDQRIVVTEKKYETLPSAWLTLNWNVKGLGRIRKTTSGNDVYYTKLGFFTGIKIIDSNSETFSAFALGPQISFQTEAKIISVGAGWVTHRTKEYANGIKEGEALPEQYDDIVFEEGTENSYLLMMSVNF